jgi:hypothetical protein
VRDGEVPGQGGHWLTAHQLLTLSYNQRNGQSNAAYIKRSLQSTSDAGPALGTIFMQLLRLLL